MNIYSKLNDQNLFSSAEQILVNYILEHKESINGFSIRKLSKQSGVSISTIYRVLDKLGVSGFSELKLQLTNHWESYQHERTNVDYNYPFGHHSTHYQILKSIQALYGSSIESTLNLIDLDVFLKTTQLINNSETIYLFTTSSNSGPAIIFKEQMATIKKKVEIIIDIYNVNSYYYTMSSKDLALIITYTNKRNYDDLMQVLKENNIKSVLITSANEKLLTKYSDIVLKVCPYENTSDKISSYASRTSILYLLDCLFSAQFNTNYEENISHRFLRNDS